MFFRKRLLSLILLGTGSFSLFSQIYSKRQLLPANHWVYDALYTLSVHTKTLTLADSAPLSVEELQFYMQNIDYDSLSNDHQALYDRLKEYFDQKPYTVNFNPIQMGFNAKLAPEFLSKTNQNIEWSFATDYTAHNAANDYTWDSVTESWQTSVSSKNYGAASNYQFNQKSQAFSGFPLYINFNDFAFFEGDFYYGNNFWTLKEDANKTNVFFGGNDQDTHWPNYVYASLGYLWKNGLGLSFQIGKEGMQIGRSMTGSIIYNNTFETDAYLKLDIYSRNFKYNSEVIEITNNRFLYLHSFTVKPVDFFKFSILEGTMINSSFEFRYLNPLMNFHSFASWNQYMTEAEKKVYGTAHASSYMAITMDFIPINNLRTYINWCMNEFQLPGERANLWGSTIPDGMGFQLGAEYNWADWQTGYYYSGIEAIYTSPYLYYKSGPEWSLYRARYNVQKNSATPICSWIGSPFGPDAAALMIKLGYNNPGSFSWEFSNLFVAHGENSFQLFNQTATDADGNVWYAYYPSVLYSLGILSSDEAASIASSWALSGLVQFTNRASFSATFDLNKFISFEGSFSYIAIYNANHVKGNIQQGFELFISANLHLFI